MAGKLLQVDPGSFAEAFARRPTAVRHSLVDHPLLALGAIEKLADRLPLKAIERHQANLPVVMPGGAPYIEGPPSETVRGIETNGCWMVLWNIEQAHEYKDLMDAILDEAEQHVGRREGGMRNRQAFLFLSAPNATTPVHFDPEHNFLLQIRGTKSMNVGRFPGEAERLRELNRYYDGGHRNLESMPVDVQTFDMAPGDGTYVPSFAPHFVKNGPAVSVSLSITFRTRLSERAENVLVFNSNMRRRLHVKNTRPVGRSQAVDLAKSAVVASWYRLRGRVAGKKEELNQNV
jgi:Cupin superfamily protein